MLKIQNRKSREFWFRDRLAAFPEEVRLLDVGAGECSNRRFCSQLNYLSQDIAQYNWRGDGVGLQTKVWDTAQINFICDLCGIPEDQTFGWFVIARRSAASEV